ncbi:hypothetical protein C9374_000768 [Naegleria lovaniensis]|uniref:BTB domain-containing protein n=1 Tax=Naegleria lovaniensis TaxID=51637 RepID=A0AA88GX03_NAELO|nr:uncharacterized protein C9374_000768 [Naegleria lovaniensis]KAG2387918.1 hypothetical protein C9374_000768 [Naegleria lovaniensis]
MSTILSVGFGGFGNLSLNQLSTQQEPKESTALSLLNVKHISVGLWHSMIVTSHGKLYGVGRNRYGALGIGEPESLDQLNYLLPVEVPLSSGVKIMKACAGKTHSIALTDDGTLFSFGFGIACGHGHTTLTGVPEPVQYLFSYRVVDCSAGEGHSAAATEDGKLFTWGLANRIKPVMVKNKEIDDELFVQVVCGAYHAIALTATGKLFGYGRNDDGQVNGETSCFISEECIVEIKHPLGEGHYWTQVSCGLKQTIALDNKGKVYIWGLIKDGLTSVSGSVKAPTLVDLSNLSSKVKKVMSGYSSFGILTQDGKLQTWGYNLHYNCCHGHNKFVQKPTMVESLSPMAINDVFMGAYNVFISCGLSATSDYSRLLHETCYFADCKLRASNGDEQVCHSCILSARSPYIAALLFKSYVTNQLSTSCAKFTSTSEKLKAEIENILTLDFIEDGNQLSQVLDLLYTNISNNIKNPKKFDDIFNSYLFNTEKSIELLQSLGNADEAKKIKRIC